MMTFVNDYHAIILDKHFSICLIIKARLDKGNINFAIKRIFGGA